jgi:Flp pilus assembly protein TadB
LLFGLVGIAKQELEKTAGALKIERRNREKAEADLKAIHDVERRSVTVVLTKFTLCIATMIVWVLLITYFTLGVWSAIGLLILAILTVFIVSHPAALTRLRISSQALEIGTAGPVGSKVERKKSV